MPHWKWLAWDGILSALSRSLIGKTNVFYKLGTPRPPDSSKALAKRRLSIHSVSPFMEDAGNTKLGP